MKKFRLPKSWFRYRQDIPEIGTYGIPFEKALNVFKKRFGQSGVPGILKQRARYPAKGERKKAKERAAMVRRLKQRRR